MSETARAIAATTTSAPTTTTEIDQPAVLPRRVDRLRPGARRDGDPGMVARGRGQAWGGVATVGQGRPAMRAPAGRRSPWPRARAGRACPEASLAPAHPSLESSARNSSRFGSISNRGSRRPSSAGWGAPRWHRPTHSCDPEPHVPGAADRRVRRRRDGPGVARRGAAGPRRRGTRASTSSWCGSTSRCRTAVPRATPWSATPRPPCGRRGLGLKAATITPEHTGDVGSPNRILREGVGGSVIVRTGRRIPGVAPPAPVVHPIVVVRMAVGDAYGAEEGRVGDAGSAGEQAWRTERIDRSVCRSVAEFSFRTAVQLDASVYGGPKWTVSTVYEGMLKEEMDGAAARYPDVPYRPTLIDAAYAGLLTESSGSAARGASPESRRGLPLGPGAGPLRLHRRRRVRAAGARRRHATRRGHGGGAARDRTLADGQERRQPHGDAVGLRRGARLRSQGR